MQIKAVQVVQARLGAVLDLLAPLHEALVSMVERAFRSGQSCHSKQHIFSGGIVEALMTSDVFRDPGLPAGPLQPRQTRSQIGIAQME